MAENETLTVRDNRTGKEYEIPISDGTIRAADLGQIKVDDDEPGLATYDPGFVNTASCKSSVTFIDGMIWLQNICPPPEARLAPAAAAMPAAAP